LELIVANNLIRFDPFSNLEEMFKDMRLAPALRGVEATARILELTLPKKPGSSAKQLTIQ
jgi:hypothetical protein